MYENNTEHHFPNDNHDHSQFPDHQQNTHCNEQNYQGTSPPSIVEETAPNGKFFSLKVHGTKAAIEVKYDRTRAGFYTIRIESALALQDKRFDWMNKVAIQLTRADILKFIAVMLMIEKEALYKHYGSNNDKSAKFLYQDGQYGKKIFSEISQKGKKLMGVPIPLDEALLIGHMALNQYIMNFPNITSDSIITSLKRKAVMTLQP